METHDDSSHIFDNVKVLQFSIKEHGRDGIIKALQQDVAEVMLLQDLAAHQIESFQATLARDRWRFVCVAESSRIGAQVLVAVRSHLRIKKSGAKKWASFASVEGLGLFVSVYAPQAPEDSPLDEQVLDNVREILEQDVRDPYTAGRHILVAGNFNCLHEAWAHRDVGSFNERNIFAERLHKLLAGYGLKTMTPNDVATTTSTSSVATTTDVAFARGRLCIADSIVRMEWLGTPVGTSQQRHHPILHLIRQHTKADAEQYDSVPSTSLARRKARESAELVSVAKMSQNSLEKSRQAIRRLLRPRIPERKISLLLDSSDSEVSRREDMERVLMKSFFPAFTTASERLPSQSSNNARADAPTARSTPEEGRSATNTKSEEAINSSEIERAMDMEVDEAPGPDGISVVLLLKSWQGSQSFRKAFSNLMQSCFEQGPIPNDWREIGVTVLHRPGRDPTLSESYRPVTQISGAAKIYERVLAERLQFAAYHGALSQHHYGAIPGRSAEDAIAHVRQAQCDTRRRYVLTGVEVKRAFDSVQHAYLGECIASRLDRTVHFHGAQTRLQAACMDWLRDREVRLSFNGKIGKLWRLQEGGAGIPKGSSMSSILWLYYVDPLLREIERRWTSNEVRILANIDSLNFLVSGTNDDAVIATLSDLHVVIRNWAKDKGRVELVEGFLLPLYPNQAGRRKTFAKRLGKVTTADKEAVGGTRTKPVTHAQMMGIVVESEGGNSATIFAKRAYSINAMRALKLLSESRTCVRFTLAKTTLWPILEYGLPSLLPFSLSTREQLEEADKRIVMWVLGLSDRRIAAKKYSYMTLCAFLGILPIRERAWVQSRAAGRMRLGHLVTAQTGIGYGKDASDNRMQQQAGPWDLRSEGIVETGTRTLRPPWSRLQPFDVASVPSSEEEARKSHDRALEEFVDIIAYANGTASDGRYGSGFALYCQGTALETKTMADMLPEHGSVLNAELHAICGALSRIVARSEGNMASAYANGLPSAMIFSSSQAAVHALSSPPRWKDAQPLSAAYDAAVSLRKIMAQNAKLEIHWVPADTDIDGVKAANAMAKDAVRVCKSLPENHSPVMIEAEATAWTKAREAYRRTMTASALQLHYDKDGGKPLKSLELQLTSSATRRRIRWLGEYFFLRQGEQKCLLCQEVVDGSTSSEAHLLLQCSYLEEHRRVAKIVKTPEDNDGWLEGRPMLDSFLSLVEEMVRRKQAENPSEQGQMRHDVLEDDDDEIDSDTMRDFCTSTEAAALIQVALDTLAWDQSDTYGSEYMDVSVE